MIREIGEELGLAEKQFRLELEPAARLDFTAWSKRASTETHYQLEVFEVALNHDADAIIGQNEANRWLSTPKIAQLATQDGSAISKTVKQVLASLDSV